MKTLLLIISVFLISCQLYAGGFQLNLLGQRQIGMGHTGTAISPDAAATVFNPGLMAFAEKQLDIQVGLNLVNTNIAYQASDNTGYTAATNNKTGTPFNFYAAYKINDKLVASFGIYTPFGSSVSWDKEWKGRYLIQDISLQAIFFQPTLSYKITDNIGLGIGFVLATGSVEINKALPIQDQQGNDANTNLKGSANGFGFNTGVNVKANEKLQFGLSYRSKITMDLKDGDATFNTPASLAGGFPSPNQFNTSLPLPSTLSFGTGYQATEKLLLAFDLNYVGWSAYDSLIFDFKENTSQLQDSRNPRKYNNTLIWRIGSELEVTEKFIARLGAYYDPSAVSDEYLNPETPDLNKIGVTAGASLLPIDNLTIDLSFLYVHGLKRTGAYSPANFEGTYKLNAFIPGFGVRYSF